MLHRRTLLALAGTAAGGLGAPLVARAAGPMPGVTKTSIKVGQTQPQSGAASAYAAIGRTSAAVFRMVNETGGINGRTIELIQADDGYNPARTVEETRRLVEAEGVAFTFNSLGTAPQTAVRQYLNARKVPQLFVSSGADKLGDPEHFPWTMGWQPSYRTEAQIFAKHMLEAAPGGKLAILYQNDDFGKDYIAGVRDVLGPRFDQVVVKTVSYEVTDPTVDSQVLALQSSGAEMLLTAATPKAAAQAIRKVAEINWHPMHFLTQVSNSTGAVMLPAGAENGRGIISANYIKDQTGPQWANDAGMNEWRGFVAKWLPGADLKDGNIVFGYGVALTLKQVLQQCGDDLTRENIMRQAANLHELALPVLLPEVRINTSPTNYRPIRQMQLCRWDGASWSLFGATQQGA